ncbi:MAG: GNAT family N-acetyltransferase [Methanospirillaceae archaeon]|nr:GNAT family N-acetyltransferase [Methanospirillaceae archaeon]
MEIARGTVRGTDIGYCIASISADNTGELDSLFVIDSYRQKGIGSELGSHALYRLNYRGVEKKRALVTYENEEVLNFYEGLGFLSQYFCS